MKNIFRIKNGRKFHTLLTKAADGDKNVCKMFIDNLDHKININPLIENGSFRDALLYAFIWGKSNEGSRFWIEVHRNLHDLKGAENEKVRRQI